MRLFALPILFWLCLCFSWAACTPTGRGWKATEPRTQAYIRQFLPFRNFLEIDAALPAGQARFSDEPVVVRFSQPMVSLAEVGREAAPGLARLAPPRARALCLGFAAGPYLSSGRGS